MRGEFIAHPEVSRYGGVTIKGWVYCATILTLLASAVIVLLIGCCIGAAAATTAFTGVNDPSVLVLVTFFVVFATGMNLLGAYLTQYGASLVQGIGGAIIAAIGAWIVCANLGMWILAGTTPLH